MRSSVHGKNKGIKGVIVFVRRPKKIKKLRVWRCACAGGRAKMIDALSDSAEWVNVGVALDER